MLAKNTLHLQYSPAFKAVEAFNEDMKRRGPWKLKAFWKYLCFLLLVMKKKETVSCQTSLHFCLQCWAIRPQPHQFSSYPASRIIHFVEHDKDPLDAFCF